MLARNREFGRQVLEALHLEQACVAVLRLLQHDVERHSGCHIPQQCGPERVGHMHEHRSVRALQPLVTATHACVQASSRDPS